MDKKEAFGKIEEAARFQEIKTALASTIDKLSASIESSHKKGKIPADYSLGFANGRDLF